MPTSSGPAAESVKSMRIPEPSGWSGGSVIGRRPVIGVSPVSALTAASCSSVPGPHATA